MKNNKTGLRELAYVVSIDKIEPIDKADKIELVTVNGWKVICKKDEYKIGDLAVYFEIDSLVPSDKECFSFLANRGYKIKTQKMRGVYSQGLVMSFEDLGLDKNKYKKGDFLTEELGVKNYQDIALEQKTPKSMINKQKTEKIYNSWYGKVLKRFKLGDALLRKICPNQPNRNGWPVGLFPSVAKTDQLRIENCPHVLEEVNTRWIRTQKCDGSSATYILHKKHFGYEFYVLSRNVRQDSPKKETYYQDIEENIYWKMAEKYHIEDNMKKYLKDTGTWFVCWQGEICGPKIQGNPHKLKDHHLFCFHMTDSKNGRYDIRKAADWWHSYNMEVVPIDEYDVFLPDDLEVFKQEADGMYDSIVCEGQSNCPREGFVYYDVNNPLRSFKNVSRKYLLKHS